MFLKKKKKNTSLIYKFTKCNIIEIHLLGVMMQLLNLHIRGVCVFLREHEGESGEEGVCIYKDNLEK